MDAEVHVLVAGHQCGAVAQAAAAVPGVARVRCADEPRYGNGLAENIAALLVALAPITDTSPPPPPSSARTCFRAPPALLDVACVSDIMEVVSPDTFVRPIYAGNALATVQSTDPVKVVSIRSTSFEAPETSGGDAPVEAVEAAGEAGLSAFVSQDLTQSERPRS